MESENIYVTKFGDIKTNKEVLGSAFHRKFSKGDILFGTRRAYLKKAGMATFDGICANTTLVLRPKHRNFVNGLLPFIVQWENFTEFAVAKSVGSTNPYVRWRDLSNFEFYLPSFDEQLKMQTLFCSIQKSIDTLKVLISKLKIYKAATMDELLTRGIGHKKFKRVKWFFGKEVEIPSGWEIKKMGDILRIKSGNTPSRKHPEFFGGNIAWVTSTDLNRSKITSTLESITKDAINKSNLTILPKGTFLIASYGLEAVGTRGKCGILTMDAACNQACMAFIPSNEIISEYLFYFYLCFGEKIIYNIAQGTKQQNLYPDTIKQVSLLTPSLLEQQKIVAILSGIDEQIVATNNHLLNLKSMRRDIINERLTPPLKQEDNVVH